MRQNDRPLRIAMWSGPRNISTAMMRAWENRPDTCVWDEPFYAHYLQHTGRDHPMRDEIIAAGETDHQAVIRQAVGQAPGDAPIFYQKHMTQHMLPHIQLDWLHQVENCFLIRDPRSVIASYAAKRGTDIGPEELGFQRQYEIFEYVRELTGAIPPVIDAGDVLMNPERTLGALCEALDVPFLSSMLNWPPGLRQSDGVWAAHWYDSVRKSTGFAPYQPREAIIPEQLEPLAEQAERWYRELYETRL